MRSTRHRHRRFRFEPLEPRLMLAVTTESPTSEGLLPDGVTPVGGIVLDLVGNNGVRVVSQLPASGLFVGFFDDGLPEEFRGDPGTIGIQSGFTQAILNALGGGLSEVAVRITLSDGDTGLGDFDENENWLLLNGLQIGNFSDVATVETSADGVTVISTNLSGGFRNNILDTGFFYSNDPAFLAAFFSSLSDGVVLYQLEDIDPFDNFFDFTQGVDGDLIDVGLPPTPEISEPPPIPANQPTPDDAVPPSDSSLLPPPDVQDLLLFVVPQQAPFIAIGPDYGTNGYLAVEPDRYSSAPTPQAIDAALATDEVDEAFLLAGFLDFVDPEMLVVDLGDEPPARVAGDSAKLSPAQDNQGGEQAAHSERQLAARDGIGESGGSVEYMKPPLEDAVEQSSVSGIRTVVLSFVTGNWRWFAGIAAALLLAGAAWKSRFTWMHAARKLWSR